jgi:putative ABC transport system substrate-binding protein
MDPCEEGHTAMRIRRRQLLAGLGGAAAWPFSARAQQGDRMRRIGVLLGGVGRSDPLANPNFSAFTRALVGLGWTEGRNVRMDLR